MAQIRACLALDVRLCSSPGVLESKLTLSALAGRPSATRHPRPSSSTTLASASTASPLKLVLGSARRAAPARSLASASLTSSCSTCTRPPTSAVSRRLLHLLTVPPFTFRFPHDLVYCPAFSILDFSHLLRWASVRNKVQGSCSALQAIASALLQRSCERPSCPQSANDVSSRRTSDSPEASSFSISDGARSERPTGSIRRAYWPSSRADPSALPRR